MLKHTLGLLLVLLISTTWAAEVPIFDFPLKNYSQNVNDYISVDDSQPLLDPSYQNQQMNRFFNHYFSSDTRGLSPWSASMVQAVLPRVKSIERELVNDFDNSLQDPLHQHFAENFKEHDATWLNAIKNNMNFLDLDASDYQESHRAIAVTNTIARALPTQEPDFYHFTIAGQGYPFDNLQESSVWAGTPLYVVSVTQDQAWSLVITPDAYFAWVNSRDLAYTSRDFIQQWQKAARKGLVAITKTQASIVDQNQIFQFSGYIGMVFPLVPVIQPRFQSAFP